MTPAEKLAKSKPKKFVKLRKTVHDCILYELRRELNLTIRDVSKATGLTAAGIHAIEHGSDPMLSTAFKLANFYGRKIEEIWEPRAELRTK